MDQMTLAELKKETIAFGTAHKGKSFQQVFDQRQPWVDWFTSTYEKSTKVEHRKFIRFVELILEEESKGNPYPKAKAQVSKAKPVAPSSSAASWTAVGVNVEDEDFEEPGSPALVLNLQEEMSYVREENRQLHGRLYQLEMNMSQILDHLQKMTVKEEK